MRICVEKAVLGDLLYIIVRQLVSQTAEIISRLGQLILPVNRNTLHIFHHQHMLGGVGRVDRRRIHIGHMLIEPAESFQIPCLRQEVHLLLGSDPHLIQYPIQIHQVSYWPIF